MADTNASPDAGASTDTGDTGGDETTTETEGAAALEAEIQKWKDLSRKNESELRKTQKTLESVQQSSMTDLEKAVAEAKQAGFQEASEAIQRDRVRDRVALAAAGRKFADPSDASALLGDIDVFIVAGEIDEKAIGQALDKLLQAKPYLGATPGAGSGEGGARGGSTPPPLNGDPLEADLRQKLGIKA